MQKIRENFLKFIKKVLELMKFIKGRKLTPIIHRTVNLVHNMQQCVVSTTFSSYKILKLVL